MPFQIEVRSTLTEERLLALGKQVTMAALATNNNKFLRQIDHLSSCSIRNDRRAWELRVNLSAVNLSMTSICS